MSYKDLVEEALSACRAVTALEEANVGDEDQAVFAYSRATAEMIADMLVGFPDDIEDHEVERLFMQRVADMRRRAEESEYALLRHPAIGEANVRVHARAGNRYRVVCTVTLVNGADPSQVSEFVDRIGEAVFAPFDAPVD